MEATDCTFAILHCSSWLAGICNLIAVTRTDRQLELLNPENRVLYRSPRNATCDPVSVAGPERGAGRGQLEATPASEFRSRRRTMRHDKQVPPGSEGTGDFDGALYHVLEHGGREGTGGVG